MPLEPCATSSKWDTPYFKQQSMKYYRKVILDANSWKVANARAMYKVLVKNCALERFVNNVNMFNGWDTRTYPRGNYDKFRFTKEIRGEKVIKNLAEIGSINNAFRWANTREGHKYWEDLYNETLELYQKYYKTKY